MSKLPEEERRNTKKMAVYTSCMNKFVWKSFRSAAYMFYLLFCCAHVLDGRSSTCTTEEFDTSSDFWVDIMSYQHTTVGKSLSLLRERPLLRQALLAVPVQECRDLIRSAGTYTDKDSHRSKLKPLSELTVEHSHEMCLKALSGVRAAKGEKDYSKQGNGSTEKKNSSRKRKTSAAGEDDKKVIAEGVEDKIAVVVQVPAQSPAHAPSPGHAPSAAHMPSLIQESPSILNTGGAPALAPGLTTPTTGIQLTRPIPPIKNPDPSRKLDVVHVDVIDADTDNYKSSQLGIASWFLVKVNAEDSVWQRMGKELTEALIRDTHRLNLIVIPDIFREHSKSSLAWNNALLKLRDSRKDNLTKTDVWNLCWEDMRFRVLIKLKQDYRERYYFTNPDGLCFYRAVWQMNKRAIHGLRWDYNQTKAHDMCLGDANSVSSFVSWWLKISAGLAKIPDDAVLGKGKYCSTARDEMIQKIQAVIQHVQTQCRLKVSKVLPVEHWGSGHYLEYIALIPDEELYFPAQILGAVNLHDRVYGILGDSTIHPTGASTEATYTLAELTDILEAPNMILYESNHFFPGPKMCINDTAAKSSFYINRELYVIDAVNKASEFLWKQMCSKATELPAMPKYLTKVGDKRKAGLEAKLKKLREEVVEIEREIQSFHH